MTTPDSAALPASDPPWSEVPESDCYAKRRGESCGPEHGWGSALGAIYRCSGTLPCTLPDDHEGDCENFYAQRSWPHTGHVSKQAETRQAGERRG